MLQNGLHVLEGVLVVHTEVEFAPIYTASRSLERYQPSLPAMALNFIISRTLVRRGSLMCPAALHSVTHPHAICGRCRVRAKPAASRNDERTAVAPIGCNYA